MMRTLVAVRCAETDVLWSELVLSSMLRMTASSCRASTTLMVWSTPSTSCFADAMSLSSRLTWRAPA